MYHDRYSRRRAADSFHEDDEEGIETEHGKQWSWALFIGVILVQVTSRSVWASFGVISIFIFGDQGPSWVLLTTPVAFAVTWGLTEPWIKRICINLTTATEFMYVIVAGTVIAWFGTIIAVKSPMELSYLVPLLGVIGGCGANIMTSASTALVRKHFPARSGAVRFFEQITASLTFFLMPILSCFTMQSFGEHGGLLIHGGILMQGFIGSTLLRSAQWKAEEYKERRPRSYTFIQEDDELFLPQSDCLLDENEQWEESMNFCKPASLLLPTPLRMEGVANEKVSPQICSGKRIAFGLGATPDTPPERRKGRTTYQGLLPSIKEIVEEETEAIEEGCPEEAEDSPVESPPATPVNTIPKPPRTFEHRFSSDRLVSKLDETKNKEEMDFYWCNVQCEMQQQSNLENPEKSQPLQNRQEKNASFSIGPCTSELVASVSVLWRIPWWKLTVDFEELWEKLSHPLTIPAAFLLYATQSCLLGFLTLTPALLDAFIDDGTRMDGAYCVCVMGFTWLCFVIASPCFSTIHFSNHQTICVVALLSSSITLYTEQVALNETSQIDEPTQIDHQFISHNINWLKNLAKFYNLTALVVVSQSSTLDEMVLYSSLFGLSYGVARMTSYSILKISFGSKTLVDLGVLLSVVASVFQLLFLAIVILWEWTHHLKNLYKFQVVALVCSALFWTVQGCVSSVRAKRGQHEFTWSRRRRVS